MRSSGGKVIMWVILFTTKLLIINFTNSYIGQAFTEGCLIKKKLIIIALTKGHFGHHGAKGQVLKHLPPPPSARACEGTFIWSSNYDYFNNYIPNVHTTCVMFTGHLYFDLQRH